MKLAHQLKTENKKTKILSKNRMSKATGQLLDQTLHLAGNCMCRHFVTEFNLTKDGKEFKVTKQVGNLLNETYHPSCN